ncbi:hypothetical protein ACLGAN_07600 [Helicobacter pylori]
MGVVVCLIFIAFLCLACWYLKALDFVLYLSCSWISFLSVVMVLSLSWIMLSLAFKSLLSVFSLLSRVCIRSWAFFVSVACFYS